MMCRGSRQQPPYRASVIVSVARLRRHRQPRLRTSPRAEGATGTPRPGSTERPEAPRACSHPCRIDNSHVRQFCDRSRHSFNGRLHHPGDTLEISGLVAEFTGVEVENRKSICSKDLDRVFIADPTPEKFVTISVSRND